MNLIIVANIILKNKILYKMSSVCLLILQTYMKECNPPSKFPSYQCYILRDMLKVCGGQLTKNQLIS